MADLVTEQGGGIFWLASYPKSGNTWMRAFLTNYVRNTHEPASINELEGGPSASSRVWFDELVGVESSWLTPDEIAALRPAVYRLTAAESERLLFLKIHDAYTHSTEGQPLVPSDVTRGAIYLLRNPLDVLISFSHHLNQPIEQTLALLNSPEGVLAGGSRRIREQLPQKLLSWSQHVLSWVEQSDFPIHVVRYEDLRADSLGAFGATLRFIGFPEDAERLARAVQHASFDTLKSQEQHKGFKERRSPSPFFRQGHSGQWQECLTPQQIAAVCQAHADVMQRFGYGTRIN